MEAEEVDDEYSFFKKIDAKLINIFLNLLVQWNNTEKTVLKHQIIF
jgi:hypothetical protein